MGFRVVMRACGNPNCGRRFDAGVTRRLYCRSWCQREAQRLNRLNKSRQIPPRRSIAAALFDAPYIDPELLVECDADYFEVLGAVSDLCIYCGWDATTVDHVLPRSWTGEVARRFMPTVPACGDCNSRIGDAYAPTLSMRKAVARASLEAEHAALLAASSWSDDEMSSLGDRMRSYIESRESLRRIVKFRLHNLGRDAGEPLADWLTLAASFGDAVAARALIDLAADSSQGPLLGPVRTAGCGDDYEAPVSPLSTGSVDAGGSDR